MSSPVTVDTAVVFSHAATATGGVTDGAPYQRCGRGMSTRRDPAFVAGRRTTARERRFLRRLAARRAAS